MNLRERIARIIAEPDAEAWRRQAGKADRIIAELAPDNDDEPDEDEDFYAGPFATERTR